MRLAASMTVEILGWFDIPAFRHGNLIDIGTGVVGIDEACSGIRSFQSTLMASMFLGELYLLRLPRRLFLLVGGLGLAFGFNVVRTLALTWRASSAGMEAMEKWHDPAGMSIFLLSFGCLWLVALWFSKHEAGSAQVQENPSPSPSWSFARTYFLAVGCWAVCILVLTEAWA